MRRFLATSSACLSTSSVSPLCADRHPAVYGEGLARDVQRSVLRGDVSLFQDFGARARYNTHENGTGLVW